MLSTLTRHNLSPLMSQNSTTTFRSILGIGFAMTFHLSSANAALEDSYTFTDGNALLTVCGDAVSALDRGARPTERDVLSVVACTSYLRGFTHGVALLSNEPEQGFGYCIPEYVPAAQTARVVVKYLRESPTILHLHPAILVNRALKFGFPCGTR